MVTSNKPDTPLFFNRLNTRFNYNSGKNAYTLGNQGSEKVANFSHPMGGVAFVEVTASTNIMSTAIDSNGNSVHSRNTSLGGELIPSQYYGKCIIK